MNRPLLYRAALQGTFGKRIELSRGSIMDALFVYLDGEPETESIARVDSCFRGKPLVCLTEGWEKLVHYFTKRNIFYRTDDMKTPMVDVMLGTFYPSDPIKVGAQNILYALRVLGCRPDSEAMQAGYKVLDQHRTENGRYVLTASKSVPAFKAGNVGEENKWVTLYACMAQE